MSASTLFRRRACRPAQADQVEGLAVAGHAVFERVVPRILQFARLRVGAEPAAGIAGRDDEVVQRIRQRAGVVLELLHLFRQRLHLRLGEVVRARSPPPRDATRGEATMPPISTTTRMISIRLKPDYKRGAEGGCCAVHHCFLGMFRLPFDSLVRFWTIFESAAIHGVAGRLFRNGPARANIAPHPITFVRS